MVKNNKDYQREARREWTAIVCALVVLALAFGWLLL